MRIEEDKISRLYSWMNGSPKGPISIHIDPSNRCNVRCRFCWQRSHERIGLVDTDNEIPDQKLMDLADEAKELGVREWLISGGGEPTIRGSATIQLMKSIKNNDMFGDIITNGTLFKENDIEELVRLGWDRIRMSINGPDAKTHDFLVSKVGAFDSAITNMRKFAHYRKKYRKKGPELGFNTVINSVNFRLFPDIVKILHEIGGCLMNVQTIILYDDEEKKWTLNEEERKELPKYLKESIRLCKRYNIHTNMRDYLDHELVDTSNEMGKMDTIMDKGHDGFLGSSCYEPWYLMTIRANGIIGSCRLFGDKGVRLQDKTLKDIWYGEYFESARKRLVDQDVPDYCKHCGANEYVQNQWIRDALIERLKKDGRWHKTI